MTLNSQLRLSCRTGVIVALAGMFVLECTGAFLLVQEGVRKGSGRFKPGIRNDNSSRGPKEAPNGASPPCCWRH